MFIFALKVIKIKQICKILNETREKEVFVYSYLHLLRKLLQQLLVSWRVNGHIPIHVPFVVKIFFNLVFELLFDWISLIKILDQSEKFREVITVIECLIELFDLIKNLDEMAHSKRKGEDTRQQNDSNQYPLSVAPRVVVPKAHGGKRCESIVNHHNSILIAIVLLQLIVLNKILSVSFLPCWHNMWNIINQIGINVKHDANKITDAENDHNQTISFKAVLDVEHNIYFGVICHHVICDIFIFAILI
jgi:hypothetical protein